jgi:hypothetical protein
VIPGDREENYENDRPRKLTKKYLIALNRSGTCTYELTQAGLGTNFDEQFIFKLMYGTFVTWVTPGVPSCELFP